MMEFIRANAGTIVTGAIVLAILAAIVIRLIGNFRKGKTGCGCCPGCSRKTG